VLLVLDAITETSLAHQPIMTFADSLGFTIIDLRQAHQGHAPETLVLAENDRHPNRLGHRLLADALYQRLVALGDTLGLGPGPISRPSQSTQEEQ
jgi:hypothetical protein